MAVKRRNPQIIVLDASHAEEAGVADSSVAPDDDMTYQDVDASLCPGCGEPLAWHESSCFVPATPSANPDVSVPASPGDVVPGLTPSPFAYALGQPVQPTPDAQAHPIIWRGQVKKRHPRTGLVHRVNVYQLDNGYWDCYYEAELQAA